MLYRLARYAVLAIVLFSGNLFADESSGRFATREDFVGFWKVEWGAAIAGNTSPYPSKYQWWAFLEDGSVVSVHANQAIEMNKTELEKFARQTRPTVKWAFKGGFVTISRTDDPSVELWGVNVWLGDYEFRPGLKINKGDLLMSLDNGFGKVRYYRRLSKLN